MPKFTIPMPYFCVFLFMIGSSLAGCTTTAPSNSEPSSVLSFETEIAASNGRAVKLTMVAPDTAGTYPLIVFSHGAFSAPSRYRALLNRYAKAGFVIAAPLHLDSELHEGPAADTQTVWSTRNEDFALAYDLPDTVLAKLGKHAITIDRSKVIAMGHSYGALVAHVAAGARPSSGSTGASSNGLADITAVLGWSPPGPVPGLMKRSGWSSIRVPSFTQTGTADVLPGFIDDWTVHRTPFEMASGKGHWLWIGDDVDHYFGGIYGRESTPTANDIRLFNRAFETSLVFLHSVFNPLSAQPIKPQVRGEIVERK